MTPPLRIEKLQRGHAIDAFDCGKAPLNTFLVRHALQSQQARSAHTYVALADDVVVGYYSLVVAQVEHADAPARAPQRRNARNSSSTNRGTPSPSRSAAADAKNVSRCARTTRWSTVPAGSRGG